MQNRSSSDSENKIPASTKAVPVDTTIHLTGNNTGRDSGNLSRTSDRKDSKVGKVDNNDILAAPSSNLKTNNIRGPPAITSGFPKILRLVIVSLAALISAFFVFVQPAFASNGATSESGSNIITVIAVIIGFGLAAMIARAVISKLSNSKITAKVAELALAMKNIFDKFDKDVKTFLLFMPVYIISQRLLFEVLVDFARFESFQTRTIVDTIFALAAFVPAYFVWRSLGNIFNILKFVKFAISNGFFPRQHSDDNLIVNNLEKLAVVAFSMSEADHNGAFNFRRLEEWVFDLEESGYRVVSGRVGGVEELVLFLRRVRRESGPADLIIISGHGSKTSLLLGVKAGRRYELNLCNAFYLRLVRNALKINGAMVLNSCSTGNRSGCVWQRVYKKIVNGRSDR